MGLDSLAQTTNLQHLCTVNAVPAIVPPDRSTKWRPPTLTTDSIVRETQLSYCSAANSEIRPDKHDSRGPTWRQR